MQKIKREKRHLKIRRRVSGDEIRPRLAVFRSLSHIYAQLIDDTKGQTLVFSCDLAIKDGSKKEKAVQVGENLAKMAMKKKIKRVVFDRGGFKYHGRIAAVAEGARKGGLEF